MAFEEKGEFEIHMETHKTQHTCHCGRSFYTQAALFIHTMGHQNSEGTEPVEVSQISSSTLKLVVLLYYLLTVDNLSCVKIIWSSLIFILEYRNVQTLNP